MDRPVTAGRAHLGLVPEEKGTMNAHKKVMFVDDEEGVRVGWNRYLSEHGFEVTTAEDGARAIHRLRDQPVDVVVSDLRMPGIDGIQLLEWIHERQPETRFILLTGYGNDEVERRVRELGAFEYLNKPITPDTLAAVVTAATHLKMLPGARAEAPMVFGGTPPTEVVTPERVARARLTEETAAAEAAPETARAEGVEEAARGTEEPPARKSRARASVEILIGLVVAPILGLAFVIFLPIIGFGALFWMLGETLWNAFKPAATT